MMGQREQSAFNERTQELIQNRDIEDREDQGQKWIRGTAKFRKSKRRVAYVKIL